MIRRPMGSKTVVLGGMINIVFFKCSSTSGQPGSIPRLLARVQHVNANAYALRTDS